MALRAVVADRLALALLERSQAMIARPEQEDEDQRGHVAPAGAEGDVAEEVEDRELVGELDETGKASGGVLVACRRRCRPANRALQRLDESAPCGCRSNP